MTDVREGVADEISALIAAQETELTRLGAERVKLEADGSGEDLMTVATAMCIEAGRHGGLIQAWEVLTGEKWPQPEPQPM